MQHFVHAPRLSHSIALFLSLENEVGCLFKLMRMGEGGGGGGVLQARVSQIKGDPSYIFLRQFFFCKLG